MQVHCTCIWKSVSYEAMWYVYAQEYQRVAGLAKTSPDDARLLLETKVRGHLVILPLRFLSAEQTLAPPGITRESLAPTVIWT